MNTQKSAALVATYGALLFLLAIVHFINEGFAFHYAAIVTAIIGMAMAAVSYFMLRRYGWAFWVGLVATFAMAIFMAWCAQLAMMELLDMVQNDKLGSPYDEGGSLLIFFTVFILSLFSGVIQVMLARSNEREL